MKTKTEEFQHDYNEDDQLYYHDLLNLTPNEFLAKYHHNNSNNNNTTTTCNESVNLQVEQEHPESKSNVFISSDVMCYIIMTYLDWKTIFTSCLLVNKEFFRRIANNRQLFIQLFNELFVMDQKMVDSMTSRSTFKKTLTSNNNFIVNGGIGIPNEHYHIWRDGYNSYLYATGKRFKQSLQKHHVNNSIMTDAKLRLIREKWNTAISGKSQQKKNQVRSKRDENKSLLNLIKKIIKDRLFMRKYFDGDRFKSKRFEFRQQIYFEKKLQVHDSLLRYTDHKKYLAKLEEAKKLYNNQDTLEKQIESLMHSEYEKPEIEEIIIGDLHDNSGPTDLFLKKFGKYSMYCGNVVSFMANDTPNKTDDNENNWNRHCLNALSSMTTENVNGIFETFPNLKALSIRGKLGDFYPVKSSHLSILILISAEISGETMKKMLECEFPQLKHLELWLGTNSNDSVHADHLEELLSPTENGKYPLLEYFGIRYSDQAEQFLKPIAQSNLLKRLRILDLSFCSKLGNYSGSDILEFAQILEQKTREAFPLLELVDIHRNYMDPFHMDNIVEIFDRLGIVLDVYYYERYKIDEYVFDW